jgi:hypothetical protein
MATECELKQDVDAAQIKLMEAERALTAFRNARDYPGRVLGSGVNTCAHGRLLRVPCWECEKACWHLAEGQSVFREY